VTAEQKLLVERPWLGRRGWRYEAGVLAVYVAVLSVLGLSALGEVGWGFLLPAAVFFAVLIWLVRAVMFLGWNRRRLTVTDRAVRIGSVLIPLADVVEVRPIRGPELPDAARQGAVSDQHRWRTHESDREAVLITQRQLDGSAANWMLGTRDADRVAHVVGGHTGTASRPEPPGVVRPVPFRGLQRVDPLRAGMLVVWGVLADVVLWVTSDLWSMITVLVLAWLARTGLRPVEIDERAIRVGTARLPAHCIQSVRCVPRGEALAASLDRSRLPLFGPQAALLVHTTDDELWGLGIPHPLDLGAVSGPPGRGER
jgi:hypothetical protein